MTPSSLLVVREPFTGRVGKDEYEFTEGELIEANHPAVAKWPDAFRAPELHYPVRPDIEEATAAPGKKRNR